MKTKRPQNLLMIDVINKGTGANFLIPAFTAPGSSSTKAAEQGIMQGSGGCPLCTSREELTVVLPDPRQSLASSGNEAFDEGTANRHRASPA